MRHNIDAIAAAAARITPPADRRSAAAIVADRVLGPLRAYLAAGGTVAAFARDLARLPGAPAAATLRAALTRAARNAGMIAARLPTANAQRLSRREIARQALALTMLEVQFWESQATILARTPVNEQNAAQAQFIRKHTANVSEIARLLAVATGGGATRSVGVEQRDSEGAAVDSGES